MRMDIYKGFMSAMFDYHIFFLGYHIPTNFPGRQRAGAHKTWTGNGCSACLKKINPSMAYSISSYFQLRVSIKGRTQTRCMVYFMGNPNYWMIARGTPTTWETTNSGIVKANSPTTWRFEIIWLTKAMDQFLGDFMILRPRPRPFHVKSVPVSRRRQFRAIEKTVTMDQEHVGVGKPLIDLVYQKGAWQRYHRFDLLGMVALALRHSPWAGTGQVPNQGTNHHCHGFWSTWKVKILAGYFINDLQSG